MSLLSPRSGFFGNNDAVLTSARTPALRPTQRISARLRPDWYQMEWAQLRPGRPVFSVTQVLGRDILLHELRVGPLIAGHVVFDPEWMVLFAPLRWQGDFLVNGQSARPNDLFLVSEANGYATYGQDRQNVIIGLRKSRVRDVCAALAGDPDNPIEFCNSVLTRASSASANLQRIVQLAMPDFRQVSYGAGRYSLPADVEDEIITGIALVLLEQRDDIRERDPGQIDPLEVVRKAVLCADSNPFRHITLADLCAASGVGKTTLHMCFSDLVGVSPMAFVRARRFSVARERLMNPVDLPRSVKDLSYSLGFNNGGRFAADYRKLFGERPSDTLAASLGRGADTPPNDLS